MGIRVVSDSSSDLFELHDIDYSTVPLKVMFDGREYIDDARLDAVKMVEDLERFDGPSTTSCPNVHEWLCAFQGAQEVFAVTISHGLSASYASAETAKRQYEQEDPARKVHIFDSLATGPVLQLIIAKVREGILAKKSFEAIRDEVSSYQQKVRILYSLESLSNLARNGRVNARVARVAEMLNIRMIGHASDEGTVELLHKCRGEKRALKTLFREMTERGFAGGKVAIHHCLNAKAASTLADMIVERFPTARTDILPCGALCSYYADKGGIIVGYETL